MKIQEILTGSVLDAMKQCYNTEISPDIVQIQETKKGFEGDLTIVVFPFVKYARVSPDVCAEKLGAYIAENTAEIASYNVVKGFLNLTISPFYWIETLREMDAHPHYGYALKPSGRKIMIEYSSPNTNKPLHLGHIRNNLLGWSVSEIRKACGDEVMMVTLVNDRGIHICKSMVAWMRYANGATPESTGKKGDHLVGDYYVRFDQEYKKEIKALMAEKGLSEEEAKHQAPILLEAQEMLRRWEAGDEKVIALWKMMNSWVYAGFDTTYKALGVNFDKVYYESQTYKKGRDLVLDGLSRGVFYRKESGSVWCDLTSDGLDHKLLLRDDGTSVYMTQDIGTASDRFREYGMDEEIYVVGNEQIYHFQVLKLVCEKLGFDWAKKIYHLSYGMVELPEGKMKSREGTVVDADDLIAEMIETAKSTSEELGKLEGYSEAEAAEVYRKVGLGSLKYFILKVDPQKTMLFNPKESIDFNGNTGSFIQYTYARIQSILRKAADESIKPQAADDVAIDPKELDLIHLMEQLPDITAEAGRRYSPALLANYAYDLAKTFNQYYHDTSILKEEDPQLRAFRLLIARQCGVTLKNTMGMLGVEMPERM